MNFNVSIFITHEHMVTVDAESEEQAIQFVKNQWENGEIEIASHDPVTVTFDTWDRDEDGTFQD